MSYGEPVDRFYEGYSAGFRAGTWGNDLAGSNSKPARGQLESAHPNPKDPQAELLSELLGELPHRQDIRPEIKVWLRSKEYSEGFNDCLDEVAAVLERKIGELNG